MVIFEVDMQFCFQQAEREMLYMNKHSISRLSGVLASIALIIGATSCGPPPTQNTPIANIAKLSFKGVSVSETEGATTKNSILLGWSAVPSGTRKVVVSKQEDAGGVSVLREIDLNTEPRQGFSDDSVIAGKKYVYYLKALSDDGKTVGNAQTDGIDIATTVDIPEFSLTSPKQLNETLTDPLGTGVKFSWSDAKTFSYYVRVTDPQLPAAQGANIMWASLLKDTQAIYGAESQSVPFYLSDKFMTSKASSPDPKQGQVAFKPLGKGTREITVMAVKASPADLSMAKSVAIRTVRGTFVGP